MTQSEIQIATASYFVVFKTVDAVKKWLGLIGFTAFKNISQGMAYFIKIFVKYLRRVLGHWNYFGEMGV